MWQLLLLSGATLIVLGLVNGTGIVVLVGLLVLVLGLLMTQERNGG